MILYMYVAPGQGLTTPWGRNFDVNRNILSLRSFVASLKKISLKSDFIHFFFHDFIHVYSPRAGADSPQGTKFWCQQKCLVTLFICYKFQKNVFEARFYTIFFMIWYMYIAPGQFFHDFIHVYSPRTGAYRPPGDKVLMSTETSCHFSHLLPVSNHRRQ